MTTGLSGSGLGEVRVPRLIVTAGLPGTGKSTIAEVLAARLGAALVSVDPIESAILAAGIDADQPTGLAAYLVAERIASRVLAAGGSVMVDAVNAVEPARLQWRDLASRMSVPLRIVETTCSDLSLHRTRLQKRVQSVGNFDDVSWRAVEQSLEEYDPWTGDCAELARVTLDTSAPLGENVERALAFVTDGQNTLA